MTDYAVIKRAVEIATAIDALPIDCEDEAVLDLFRPGDREAFVFMDEQPGDLEFSHLRSRGSAVSRYGWWHMRLRIVRNNPDNDLFERMS